jgi:hypothetical protein
MKASNDPDDSVPADETDVDEDLYQLNDIGLALRLSALREFA